PVLGRIYQPPGRSGYSPQSHEALQVADIADRGRPRRRYSRRCSRTSSALIEATCGKDLYILSTRKTAHLRGFFHRSRRGWPLLARDDDHPPRTYRIRLAVESPEHRRHVQPHAFQEAGDLGQRVEPDDMSDRLAAASVRV